MCKAVPEYIIVTMSDTFLVVASTILTVLLAAIGFEVTAHPPSNRKLVWMYRAAIIVLGIGMIGVNVAQNSRDSRARAELESKHHQDEVENLRVLNTVQARLEAVGNLVLNYAKNSPPSEKTRRLADAVGKLSAPNPPTGLSATAH